MRESQYYRAYLQLQKKHERLSYRIVKKGLRKQFEYASETYLQQPNTPLNLLVKESDTLNFINAIYQSIGIEMALLVDRSLAKYKAFKPTYQVKAARKPKEYTPTNQDPKINIWKDEFVRLTQTKEIADKVSKVTETTKQQIRVIVQRGVEEKLSHKQIAKLILDETDSIKTKQRALTIARTEGAYASNKSATFAAKTSGLVLYKKWIARKVDAKTRDAHLGMVDSAAIPIDGLFTVGGESMAHPCDGSNGAGAGNIVNCRCIISFVPASTVVGKGVNKPKPVKPSTPKPVQTQLDLTKPFPLDLDDINIFKPAKTIEEAFAFNEAHLSKTVDKSWLKDVGIANRINKLAFDLKNEYKLNKLREFGTKVRSKSALMSANFQTLNMRHSLWKSENMMARHYASNQAQKKILQSNLELCRKKYEETKDFIWYERLKKYEKKAMFTNGWTVEYSEAQFLENTMIHEYGHIIQDQLLGGLNGVRYMDEARRANRFYMTRAEQLQAEHLANYRNAMRNGDIYKISEYGASNQAEFFAESFVMYRAKDPNLPTYLVEFFDKLKDLNKLL